MEEEIKFRKIPFERHWASSIISLYIECFNAPDKGENWTIKSAEAYFLERVAEDSVFYALTKEKEILALIMGGPFEKCFLYNEIALKPDNAFYISLVATNPESRHKGLSHKIMSLVEEEVKKEEFKSFIVRCRSENIPVQGLFRKNHFETRMRYTSELGGVICERLILTKDLK